MCARVGGMEMFLGGEGQARKITSFGSHNAAGCQLNGSAVSTQSRKDPVEVRPC